MLVLIGVDDFLEEMEREAVVAGDRRFDSFRPTVR
jgi:hypothetical protein